jgi:hypothetical protein
MTSIGSPIVTTDIKSTGSGETAGPTVPPTGREIPESNDDLGTARGTPEDVDASKLLD